jgi:hypothetical protein
VYDIYVDYDGENSTETWVEAPASVGKMTFTTYSKDCESLYFRSTSGEGFQYGTYDLVKKEIIEHKTDRRPASHDEAGKCRPTSAAISRSE